jgi:hypothetical protein
MDMVPQFENALYTMRKNKKGRKRAVGGGKRGVLPTVEGKLFFILFYLKAYPTFDVLAFLFKKRRSRAWEDVQELLPLLKQVLGRACALPERQIRSVAEFREQFPGVKDIFPDGTERRMYRPKYPKKNRRMYSGKKKAHTRKNVLVVDDRKRILMMSPTKPGRRHDKRIAGSSPNAYLIKSLSGETQASMVWTSVT